MVIDFHFPLFSMLLGVLHYSHVFAARNHGRLGPKTSEKLLRPPPFRSPTSPAPTIRLPRNLPRGLRARGRRGSQLVQFVRSRPQTKLQHKKRRHPRHRHDGFRIRRSCQTPPHHLLHPLQPGNGQNGIHAGNRAPGPPGGECSYGLGIPPISRYQ